MLGLFAEDMGFPDRPAAKILRWALLFSAYNYKLEYRPGESYCNAEVAYLRNKIGRCITTRGALIHRMRLVNSPVLETEV